MTARPSAPYPRQTPWTIGGLIAWYGAVAVGAAAMLASWYGASGTAVVPDQLPWLNVGVVGAIVMATGNAAWLMTGRRSLGERRRAVLDDIPLPVAREVPASNGSARYVAASGMARYHRSDCQLVVGKTASAATAAGHQRAGRRPCGVCQP